jgi:cell division septal protein FtsQ
MRDYKNVRVPKKYYTSSNRVVTKRVEATRTIRRRPGNGIEKIRSTAFTVLTITVIVAGSWLGWKSYQIITHAELFQIAGVDIRGVHQLGEPDLKKIVGAFTGQNIFRADLDAAVRRAKANSWVREVTLYRSLPNRISMVVTERVPYAILDTGAEKFLMDNEGVIIDRFSKEKAAAWRLPVIAVKNYPAQAGEQVTSEGMGEALNLIPEITRRGGWRIENVTIKASSPESLALVYAKYVLKLGSGQYAEKLRRLAEVMADVKQRNQTIAYVDLRPDRQVAVMVKNDHRVKGKAVRK